MLLRTALAAAAAGLSASAHAHGGHAAATEWHWHPTDAWGFVALAAGVAILIWLSRRG